MNDSAPHRLCPGVSSEEEASLLAIAHEDQPAWLSFTSSLPTGDRREFLADRLRRHGWPTTTFDAAADCLHTQFVRIDNEITADDEERLGNVANALRSQPWPVGKRYFDVLECAVSAEFKNDQPNIFRIRALTTRLNAHFLHGL